MALLDHECKAISEGLDFDIPAAGRHVVQNFVLQDDGSLHLPDPPDTADSLTGEKKSFWLNIGSEDDAEREDKPGLFSVNAQSSNELHSRSNQPPDVEVDNLDLFGYPITNLQSWSKHPAQGDKYHSVSLDSFMFSSLENQQLPRESSNSNATIDMSTQSGQFVSDNVHGNSGKTDNKDNMCDDFIASSIKDSGVNAEDISSNFAIQSSGLTDLSYTSGLVDEIGNVARTSDCSLPFMYYTTLPRTELQHVFSAQNDSEPKHSMFNNTDLLLDRDFRCGNQVDFILGRHSFLPPVQMSDFHEAFFQRPVESFRSESSMESSSFPSSRHSFSADFDTSISQSCKKQKLLLKNETVDQIQACDTQRTCNEVTASLMLKNLPSSNIILDDDDMSILDDISEPSGLPLPRQNVEHFTAQQHGSQDHNQPRLGGIKCKNDERVTLRRALQDLSQPTSEANPPEGFLSVPLLRHQRIALSWMVQKETCSHSDYAYCSGGILADDQGLGKTISTIALILLERSPSAKFCSGVVKQENTEALNLDDDGEYLDDTKLPYTSSPFGINGSKKKENPAMVTNNRPAAGTLVVCPTSVLRQWADELQNKVTPRANLSFLVYHGANRTKDPNELAKYDVVLTTYSIISMEVPTKTLGGGGDDDDEDEKAKCAASNEESLTNKKRKSSSSKRKGSKDDNAIEVIKPSINTLGRVNWFRVILDEAQSIKNRKTQVAKSCWGLRAKRRWCLSGTPIQNAVDDLYSYFRFLRYEKYADYNEFCSLIKTPISKNPINGYKKLQDVLKTTMLRRTKESCIDGKPIITLPLKTITLKKVEFSQEERAIYSSLEAESREQYQAYAAEGTSKQNYVNILSMLLRLRQACDHPLLVKVDDSSSVQRSSLEMAQKLPKAIQQDLLNRMEAPSVTCAMCNNPPEDTVITTCGHVFCNQCICEHLVSDDNICPIASCEFQLNFSSIFSKATLIHSISIIPGDVNDYHDFSSCSVYPTMLSENISPSHSSKIKSALEILSSLPKLGSLDQSNEETCLLENSNDDFTARCSLNANEQEKSCMPTLPDTHVTEKAIVFSQWTKMLDLFEVPLKESGIQYRRLDGTMSIAARDKVVKDFKTIPEVTVIIMSLKAASLGLNMVEANHVILLDLWWNPTTEDQAIDRAHRIGQTRPVFVSRLTVKDTVEDRMLALQEKKRQMVASAFGEDESGSRQTRLTMEDLDYLFMV